MLREGFEPDSGITNGTIAGQNEWTLSSGAAKVQTNEVQSGTRALEMTRATIMHDISSTNGALWIRFHAHIGGAPRSMPGEANPNTSAAFFVGTNLNIFAYSNNVPTDLGVAMPTNIWTRFDIYCDYGLMAWNLSMDGTTIGAGLPLYSTGTTLDSVLISDYGNSSSYIDQLEILDHELASDAPDFDADNIPDWWELQNFGGITAAVAGGISSNSGLSFLETYIAGVQPLAYDPFVVTYSDPGNMNWRSVPGRSYDILWAPSLSSNFTSIASVDWPVEEYTDLTNSTGTAGFYRLNVSIK